MLSKSKLVNQARQHDSLTANGAVTHSTSLHSVVDMFFLAGGSRNMSESDILSLRTSAYVEDKQLAFKCLFRARDIRGGAGERRFFRTIWDSLSKEDIKHYQQFVSEYGRRDDLHETSLDFLASLFQQPEQLGNQFGLLCKRTPRKGKVFEYIRKKLGFSPKKLRQLLVEHTNVVEQLMSAKEWDAIEYKKVPSQAFQKYKKAFMRNDEARFTQFIEENAKDIKSGTLFPYQLYQSFKKGEDNNIINEQWKNLPDYVAEGKTFLPMCDVSGSMGLQYRNKGSLQPIDISISLGVYLSERNRSIFKDAFITFTSKPTMQYLKGTACQRFDQIKGPVGYDTNLQKAFEMLLLTAKSNGLTQEDMPDNILVISDMEFNDSNVGGLTNHEAIQKSYELNGYKMPNLVYWNVNGRLGNVPVEYNKQGVALVSGASPAIIKHLLGHEDFSPQGIMMKTLSSERYTQIK